MKIPPPCRFGFAVKDSANPARSPGTVSLDFMGSSDHYDEVSRRPDRIEIKREWEESARDAPEFKEFQQNGRTRHWIHIHETGRWLRVVVLPDGEILTKFWDRGFPKKLARFEEGKEWRMVRCENRED